MLGVSTYLYFLTFVTYLEEVTHSVLHLFFNTWHLIIASKVQFKCIYKFIDVLINYYNHECNLCRQYVNCVHLVITSYIVKPTILQKDHICHGTQTFKVPS